MDGMVFSTYHLYFHSNLKQYLTTFYRFSFLSIIFYLIKKKSFFSPSLKIYSLLLHTGSVLSILGVYETCFVFDLLQQMMICLKADHVAGSDICVCCLQKVFWRVSERKIFCNLPCRICQHSICWWYIQSCITADSQSQHLFQLYLQRQEKNICKKIQNGSDMSSRSNNKLIIVICT